MERTLRQRAVVWIVELIEWAVNSRWMMVLLRILSSIHWRCRMFRGTNVAFICDGNRRYARRSCESSEDARGKGLRKIYELVETGHRLGLEEVSFFCFAIKNFRRSHEEIDSLMGVIRDKHHRPETVRVRPRFRIYGRMDLLDENIRSELARMERETETHTDIVANIFFAYSAEDEIARGVQFCSRVDLLVRTGGVRRLSDFMLRQVASGTAVFFADALWPEFSSMHLHLILLKHWLETRYLGNID